jgi:hypothetical protein
LVFAVLAAVLPPPSIAGAEEVAQLQGVATAHDGTALRNVQVLAQLVGSTSWEGFASSDGTGHYSMSLAPGTYRIYVNPFYAGPYLAEYYPGAATAAGAQSVAVSAATSNRLDLVVRELPRIAGLLLSSDGSPAASAVIDIWNDTTSQSYWAYTDVTGHYDRHVYPGSYKVRFRTPAGTNDLDEYWPDTLELSEATMVEAEPDVVRTLNAKLAVGAEIVGIIRSVAGDPVDTAWVFASGRDHSDSALVQTASDGTYALRGLREDQYYVEVSPPWPFMSEIYDNHQFTAEADRVPATIGSPRQLNITVERYSGLQGAVTMPDGAPVPPFTPVVFEDSTGRKFEGTTDVNGRYSYLGIRYGKWKVTVQPDPSTSLVTKTVEVNVADGTTATQDVRLEIGGRISGQISSRRGLPVQQTTVQFVQSDGAIVAAIVAADDGSFLSPVLPVSRYVVRFVPTPGVHAEQYYEDTTSFTKAERVKVTATTTRAHVDAALRTTR